MVGLFWQLGGAGTSMKKGGSFMEKVYWGKQWRHRVIGYCVAGFRLGNAQGGESRVRLEKGVELSADLFPFHLL